MASHSWARPHEERRNNSFEFLQKVNTVTRVLDKTLNDLKVLKKGLTVGTTIEEEQKQCLFELKKQIGIAVCDLSEAQRIHTPNFQHLSLENAVPMSIFIDYEDIHPEIDRKEFMPSPSSTQPRRKWRKPKKKILGSAPIEQQTRDTLKP